jgi:hypothetical protein
MAGIEKGHIKGFRYPLLIKTGIRTMIKRGIMRLTMIKDREMVMMFMNLNMMNRMNTLITKFSRMMNTIIGKRNQVCS